MTSTGEYVAGTEKIWLFMALSFAGHMTDPVDLPGLAHFCEHMVFLGSKKVCAILLAYMLRFHFM